MVLKPRSQMPLRTATNAVRTIFRQWNFGKTMEKQGDSYEIIVRTNLCDRSIRGCRTMTPSKKSINIFVNLDFFFQDILQRVSTVDGTY